MKFGFKLVGTGLVVLGLGWILQFGVWGEEKCSVIDWLLFRDAREIVECTLYPYTQIRGTAAVIIGMGLLAVVGSGVAELVSRWRT